MKSITELFSDALRRKKERNFPNLYIALDLHGTVFKPSRRTEISNNLEKVVSLEDSEEIAYPYALQVLRLLTASDTCKLILWTSSPKYTIDSLKNFLEFHGVKIAYVNENPDYKRNTYADFSKKFCFDILLDDKAGFDPENDWKLLWNYLNDMDWRKFYVSDN